MIRLPEGFSNILVVKLAVLYMEQYLVSTRKSAPHRGRWKVEDDIATYIYLAELFSFVGMEKASRDLEGSILRRLRNSPLQIEDIRAIWNRDNYTHPSRYIKAMADNIVTFMYVPRLHLFAIQHDIEPEETYEEVVQNKMKRMKDAYPKKEG